MTAQDEPLGSARQELAELKRLCTKAADALDIMTQMLLISDVPLEWEETKRKENKTLIAELRKAAECAHPR